MKKNAIILQGAGETVDSFWLPWLAKELREREREYKIWLPQLPDNDSPNLTKTLPYVLNNGIFNQETVLIGHSAGCPLILSVLENIEVQIKQAILVAGLIAPDASDPQEIKDFKNKYLQKQYNWSVIKSHCHNFVFINSTKDPWKCNDIQGRMMFDQLGGMLIINQDGHMGSDRYNQPYQKFPLLLKLIEE